MDILIFFSQLCLDFWQSTLLLLVASGQLFGECFACFLIVVVGVLPHVKVVGIATFSQTSVIQLPTPGKHPRYLLFLLLRWVKSELEGFSHWPFCPST